MAKQHWILKNPKIPDATAVKKAKPMAQEQARLTRVIGGPPDEEDESMAEGALENMLRKIIKGTKTKQKAMLVTPVRPETATTTTKTKLLFPQTPATPLELHKRILHFRKDPFERVEHKQRQVRRFGTSRKEKCEESFGGIDRTTIGIGSSHHICLTASGDG